MSVLSAAQVYALATAAGLSSSSAVTATAIAHAESSFNTDALNPSAAGGEWGPAVGLWQIRSLTAQTGTGGDRDASQLTNAEFNAKAMYEISNGGSNWMPWQTYTSGAYKAFLPGAQGAAGGSSGSTSSDSTSSAEDVLSLNPGDWVSGLVSGLQSDFLTAIVYLAALAAAGGLVIAGGLKLADKQSSSSGGPSIGRAAAEAAVLA